MLIYQAKPFDEPPPQQPQRKPPARVVRDRGDFASERAFKAQQAQDDALYNQEMAAYGTEQAAYNTKYNAWLGRKQTWDATEQAKVNQSLGPLREYQQGVLGHYIMPSAAVTAYPLGGAAGALESHLAGNVLWNRFGEGGGAYEASPGVRALIALAGLPLAAKSYLIGEEAKQFGQRPSATPFEEGLSQTGGNFMEGYAAGNLGYSILNALRGIGGRGTAEDTGGGGPPPDMAPIVKGTARKDAVEALADYLKVPYGPRSPKGETWNNVKPLLSNAPDDTIRAMAPGFGLDKGLDVAQLRASILQKATEWGTKGGVVKALPLALGLGAGAAAIASSSDPVKAAERLAADTLQGYQPLGPASSEGEASGQAAPFIGPAVEAYNAIKNIPAEAAALPPSAVPGPFSDPLVAAHRIAMAKQQHFQGTLDDFVNHISTMKAKYGGAPASGGGVPTGGGMPGLTGVPGAGAGSGPANFVAVPSPQAGGLSPGTAAILQAMQAGRTQSNALNYLLGRPY